MLAADSSRHAATITQQYHSFVRLFSMTYFPKMLTACCIRSRT